MKDLPKQYKNILHPVEAEHLSSQFNIWSETWAMSNATVHEEYTPDFDRDERVVDAPSAIWPLYSDIRNIEERSKNPFLIKYSKKIAETVAKDLGLTIKQYIRIKANILFNDFGQSKDQFCAPHTDYTKGSNTISIVYYVDDCDGSTFIFPDHCPKKRTLGRAIEFKPEMNAATVFPSEVMHAGQCPTTAPRRYVINIVFEYGDINE